MSAPFDIDLDDPGLLLRDDVLADPGPLYDALRRDAPVWQIPGQQSFVVVDPVLIKDAVGRTTELSSNLVSLLHRDERGCPVTFDIAPAGDPVHVLATADPPAHTRHRKVVQQRLSPAAVARIEPSLRSWCDERLALMLASGGGDVVERISNPIPALAICALVGAPLEDADRLVDLVLRTGALLDGVTDLDGMAHASVAALEIVTYADAQLSRARAQPPPARGDLAGVLVDAVDEGAIDVGEARDMLVQLFNAGTETTASLIATSLETVARRPELQDELRDEPGRIPDAIEDVLREDGPFQFHYRWTTTEIMLGDTVIPAASRVLLMWAAANRSSTSGPHFAFGRGAHFCIGAPLARLEARVALEQVLAQTSSIRLDPQHPPARRPSVFLRRHTSLPVRVTRAVE